MKLKAFAFISLIIVVSYGGDSCWAFITSTDAAPIDTKNVFHFLYVNGENDDGDKVEKLKKIFLKFEDTLKKNIGKWKKDNGDDIPNLLKFVMKDDEALNKDLEYAMKKIIPETRHATFLRKLNKFLNNLSKGKVESIHFFRNAVGVKVNKGELNEKRKDPIEYELHSSVTIPARNRNSEKKEIRYMKKRLQNHVKKWTEPSFMEYEESKLLKRHLKDVTLNVFTTPSNIILPVKSEVLVNCIVTSNSPVNIRWEIDGKVIPSYHTETDDMYVYPNGSLYIKSARKKDVGVYTCIASTSTEKRYATSVLTIAYLQRMAPIAPVTASQGDSEASIKCIPPYGIPSPTVKWEKNGKLIEDSRIKTDTWTLLIRDVKLSDAGNYTCYATNMVKQRNTTTTLGVFSKDSYERWVGQHFTKPHHLSIEETDDNAMDVKPELLELSDDSKSIEREIQENGIGKALLKSLLEERNDLPWASNDVLSKLTSKEKQDYLDAEREWEMKLTQETQRLLDKLQPADAYIIPDVPIYDGDQTKKLKGLDAARVIKKELEDVARRKIMFTGNEDWDAVQGGEEKEKAKSTPIIPKEANTKRNEAKLKGKLDSEYFENKLAEEEEEWIGVEKDAWLKIKNLEKYLNELKN